MKKLISIVMFLLIISAAFASCNITEPVTLENMKNTLADSGYKDIENLNSLPENAIGGFTFVFLGAHGYADIPVFEFKDESSADNYAEYVNEDHLAIVSGKFLTIAEAHHGVAHADEKTFLENLINGISIK